MTSGSGSARREALWLGRAVGVVGVATLVGVLLPRWRVRVTAVEGLLTPQVVNAAAGAVVLAGLALVLVGSGVARRRRAAWALAVGFSLVATLAHLAKGPDIDAAAVTAALAGILVWRRHLFVVPMGPARLATGARLVAAAVGLTLAYGVTGLVLHRHHLQPRLTPTRALAEITARLVGQSGPLQMGGRFGSWFPASLTVLGGSILALVLLVVLAPIAVRGGGSSTDAAEAARLVRRPDGDTLDPFVLRRDKRRVFAPDRRAAIGFRYVHGVALASGDPVGDPGSFDAAVGEFVEQCDQFGWRPAIIGARGDRLALYERHGLRGFYVGDEAVIDVAGFSLGGGRMRNARHAVNRSHNFEVTTERWSEGELEPLLRQQLLSVAAAQRGAFREFGFSMALGDLLTGHHPDCIVVVCRDRAGRPIAFERYVPCRGGRALSLDTMRRRPDAPNGVHERMIVDTINWARAHEVEELSLNFAAFRSLLDDETERQPLQAAEAWCLRRMDGRFGIQLDTLRRFNAKFAPRWVPRYVIYRSRADLPAIGLAALSAEGFLPLDWSRQERDPGAAAATPAPA